MSGADDVMLYKVCLFSMLDSIAHFWGHWQARENVHEAIDIKDPNEKQAILGESLRLLKHFFNFHRYQKAAVSCPRH